MTNKPKRPEPKLCGHVTCPECKRVGAMEMWDAWEKWLFGGLDEEGRIIMADRPKKKEKTADRQLNTWEGKVEHIKYYESDRDIGYNKACDDWEKWLPSEEEMWKIMCGINDNCTRQMRLRRYAKAISQRLKGGKNVYKR